MTKNLASVIVLCGSFLFCRGYNDDVIPYCKQYCSKLPCNESFPNLNSVDFRLCNEIAQLCGTPQCPEQSSRSLAVQVTILIVIILLFISLCFLCIYIYRGVRFQSCGAQCWDFFFLNQPTSQHLVNERGGDYNSTSGQTNVAVEGDSNRTGSGNDLPPEYNPPPEYNEIKRSSQ